MRSSYLELSNALLSCNYFTFDSRLIVEQVTDLPQVGTKEGEYLYNGKIALVTNDPNPSHNGTWACILGPEESTWSFIGTNDVKSEDDLVVAERCSFCGTKIINVNASHCPSCAAPY